MKVDYDSIALQFLLQDFTWNIDGEKKVPTAEEIKAAVERATVLLDEVGGGTLTVGHLVITKMDDSEAVYDIYVHMGTLGE